MSGHVFIVPGDLHKIHCDAWLLPTDGDFDITPSFAAAVEPLVNSRLPDRSWHGERVQPYGDRQLGTPWVWLADIGRSDPDPSDYAAVGDPFARGVRAAFGRDTPTPVLAVNLLGSGEGGGRGIRGELLVALMVALHDAAQTHGVDLVLVAWRRTAYAAAQRARRRYLGTKPLSQLFALGGRQPDLEAQAKELANFARSRQLVLFLGSGASAGANLPGWQELLKGLARKAGLEEGTELVQLEKLDVRDQAVLLRKRLGSTKEMEVQIRERLAASRHSLTQALLAALPVKESVTTNYDRLFEMAVRATGDSIVVLPHEPLTSEERWLLKLHGSVEKDGSIVLTRRDYLGLANTHGALFGLVQALLLTRHMLFVGYSLSDEDFHQLVHEVRQARGGDAVSLFGTVLTLEDRPLFTELWSDDLEVVPMANVVEEVAAAPRTLQIFLDLVGFLATDLLGSVLDHKYDHLLDADEQRLQVVLTELDRVAEGLDVAARRPIVEFLRSFGGGSIPSGFLPRLGPRQVEEGIEVRSLSGRIEGRTTGSCRPCTTTTCPGWFIGVRWETGQLMHICSKGWKWDPESRTVRVTGGGEISARFVAPAPLGTPPLPEEQWPDRAWLLGTAGWRVLRQ